LKVIKVIHLSTSDFDGGAAIAALRVVKAQQSLTVLNSKLFVRSEKSEEEFVFSRNTNLLDRFFTNSRKLFDELSIRLLSVQSRGRFTFPFWGEDISKNILVKNSDIINLHWINGGFLSLKSLERLVGLKKPIVWTLHDMWAITGGCHHAADCEKFALSCSNCPSLRIRGQKDISNLVFNRKQLLFNYSNFSIISCSNWLSTKVISSKLFGNKKTYTIPNPLDTSKFKPLSKYKAREKLNLPKEKQLILVGAMNINNVWKGFEYLINAVNLMHQSNPDLVNVELVVFGKSNKNILNKIPFHVHQLGKLKNEDEIIYAYNSADIYVAPSLQDNLPNTVMEAMGCGVPVVAFNVGGIPDMIDHNINGILATPRSSEELANGIKRLLTDDNLRKTFSINARDKVVKNFDEKIVAEKYLEVYKTLI
jgi:glycosyltransferase involved in cell wall biosynthesis